MLKEAFVSRAQIVQSRFIILGFGKSVSGAFAMTCKLPLALATLCWQAFGFHVSKGHLLFAVQHIQNTAIADIAKIILGENKVVATVDVTIMLHHCSMATPV